MASPGTVYEPLPRMAPFTASIGGKLYMWGGITERGRRRLRSVVEVFDPYIEVWSQQPTTGTPPPLGLRDGACAAIADCIYICCGYDGSSYYNSLHELCVTTWKWRGIGIRNPSEGPMRKLGCQMVVYEGKLVLFGGFGIPTHHGDHMPPGASFIKNTMRTDGSGWTNELHIVHPKEGVWSSPANRGKRPPACASFTFTLISAHSAVVFGGHVPGQDDGVDSVHVIVFITMMWTALQRSVNGLWPVGRSYHAACCIQYGEGRPQLLVTGGLDNDDKPLGDAWLLDVNPGSWKEVRLPAVVLPRWSHAMSVLQLAVGLMEATIFGGSPMDLNLRATDDQVPKLADTTVLQLESVEVSGMDQKEWVLTGITRHDQLGKPDQLREKMITLAERATVSKQQVVEAERRAEQELEQAAAALREAERRERELQETATASEEQAKGLERVLEAEAVKTRDAEQRAQEATTQVRALQQQLPVLEQQASRVPALEQQASRVSTLEQQASWVPALEQQASRVPALEQQASRVPMLEQKVSQLEVQLSSLLQQANRVPALERQASRVPALEQQVSWVPALEQQASRVPALEQQVSHLRYHLSQRESEVREKEEEMGRQQQLFQVEKKELTSQIDYLRARMGKEPPQVPGIQEAESQQRAQEEMEVLRRTRVEQDARMSQLEEELLGKDEQLRLRAEEVVSVRREREEEVQRLQEDSHEWRERALRSEHLESGSRSMVEQYVELAEMKEEVEEERRALQLATRDQATANMTPPLFSYLRGAEVVDQRRFHITAQPQNFEWKENGFRLHVLDGCLPAGTTDVTLDVGVSLSGQFELPADSQLVSAVFWLQSSVKLEKPVVIEMEHCVSLTDPSHCSQLSFVITQCHQKELPYSFRPLEGGVFSLNSSFGSISRTQFSGLGIIRRRFGRSEAEVRYRGQQFYQRHPSHWIVHFVVVKSLRAHLKHFHRVVDKKYSSWITFEPFTFQFSEDSLSLDLPKEGKALDGGWKVIPMSTATVDRSEVDRQLNSYTSGRTLPGFELKLKWTQPGRPPESFDHALELHGAKGAKGAIHFNLCIEVIAGGSRDNSSAYQSPSAPPPSGDSLYSKYPAGLQGKPEMKDLTNEVVAVIPDLWQEVGLQLDVPYNDMSGYHERNPTTARMFTYVLVTWRNRCTSEYSWANLIKALRSPSVNQVRLADELTKKLTAPQESQQLDQAGEHPLAKEGAGVLLDGRTAMVPVDCVLNSGQL